MGNDPAVLAEGLRKCYGRLARGRHYPAHLRGVALAGLDLRVAEGGVHAVLGPNGAGKTTVVRILTTLLRPDAGRARVLGLDVRSDADRLRSRIGLAGQYAAVDVVAEPGGKPGLVAYAHRSRRGHPPPAGAGGPGRGATRTLGGACRPAPPPGRG